MSIKIEFKDLGRELKARARGTRRAVRRGIVSAAQRSKTLIVRRTPADRGELKAAWEVKRKGVIELVNEAPYVGIVELGARPHKVSAEGIAAIAGWARRKLGLVEEDAAGVAHAIAWKIRREGQEPTFFVQGSLEDMNSLVKAQVEKSIKKAANKKAMSSRKKKVV